MIAFLRRREIHVSTFIKGGGDGGPNLQPPIPSRCTATPSFQEKIIVDFPPPRAVSPPTLSHLTLFPPPPPRTLVLFHTLHKNVYALFKEGALLKIYINRL